MAGWYTHNINCCKHFILYYQKTIVYTTWQSWECLLGSPYCQACSGQTARSCCTFRIHCSHALLNDKTWQGDCSQAISAQCSGPVRAIFMLRLPVGLVRPSQLHCSLRVPLLNPLPSLCLHRWLTYISVSGSAWPFLFLPFYLLSVSPHSLKLTQFHLNICFTEDMD